MNNLSIRSIDYQECLPLWQQLWATRVSAIKPTSSMLLPADTTVRSYTDVIGEPTFLGVFDGSYLVGVNSFHDVGEQQRSRGLFVLPEYRGHGIGLWLLKSTLSHHDSDKIMFSYPRDSALTTYLNAGFRVVGDKIYDYLEHKFNYYVTT